MINILHILPHFNNSCGVSRYVYNLFREFSHLKDYKLYLLIGKGDAIKKLQSIGAEYQTLEISGSYEKIFYLLKNYNSIKNFCKRNHIDILHTHHRYPEYIASLVSGKLGIPTVATIHSLVSGFKWLSFRSDKVIAVSKAVEKHIIKEFKVPEEKIIQLYNYIEPFSEINENDKQRFREEIGISKDKKVILFAGRISKVKGCDTLIKALNKLPSELNTVLVMAGKIYDNSIHSLIEKNSRIIYCQPSERIEYFYSICDLIVLPSRVDPFPFVMLESGMCKKPFIGSDVDGISEFIEHGKNGLLFQKENVNALADAIQFYLLNQDIALKHASNLNQKVNEMTNKENYIQNLCSIYKGLIMEGI